LKFLYLYITFISLILFSCTLEKKNFDNPVDFEANDALGVGAPTIVFYPLTQTKTLQDSVEIGSYIVFKEDSIKAFSGVHLRIHFPDDLLDLDTILPGLLMTDTNQSTPLFNYLYDEESSIDIYAYFLDTVKQSLEATGHIANIKFKSKSIGYDSIYYNMDECEVINFDDDIIQLNGQRSAEIIIE
jgi:hypothetical protein